MIPFHTRPASRHILPCHLGTHSTKLLPADFWDAIKIYTAPILFRVSRHSIEVPRLLSSPQTKASSLYRLRYSRLTLVRKISSVMLWWYRFDHAIAVATATG